MTVRILDDVHVSASNEPAPSPSVAEPLLATDRPLRLRRDFLVREGLLGALRFLLGVALLCFGTLGVAAEYQRLQADVALWELGEDGENEDTVVQSAFPYVVFDVTYANARGELVRAEQRFPLLFARERPPPYVHVRFDPNDPKRIVTAWSVHEAAERQKTLVVLAILAVTLGAAAFAFGGRALSALLSARACARDGEERILRLVRAYPRTPLGAAFRLATSRSAGKGGVERPDGTSVVVRFAEFRSPFFVDAARTEVLVLQSRSNPRRLVALRDDLYPFAFARGEAVRVRERLEREAPPSAPSAQQT